MKTLNEHGVCTDPETIDIYFNDHLNCIQIKIAEIAAGWANGYDLADRTGGMCTPCTLNGCSTREQSITHALDQIVQTRIVQENPKYKKAIRVFEAERIEQTLF